MPVFFAAFFVERLAAFFAGRPFDAVERFAGLVFLVDFFVDFSRPFCDTDFFVVADFFVPACLLVLGGNLVLVFVDSVVAAIADASPLPPPRSSDSDFISGGVPGIKLSASCCCCSTNACWF